MKNSAQRTRIDGRLCDLTATYDGSAHYASATTDAGTYDVTAVIMDPDYLGSAADKLVIKLAKLTVKSGDQIKVYKASLPALAGSPTGVVNGDGITASYATDATADNPVGSYSILPVLSDPNHCVQNYTVDATNGTQARNLAAVKQPNGTTCIGNVCIR